MSPYRSLLFRFLSFLSSFAPIGRMKKTIGMEQARELAATGRSGGAPAAESKLRRIAEVDQTLSRRIYDACQPLFPRPILKALEISGDGRIWIPIPIAVLLAARSAPMDRVAAGLLAGFLLDLLCVGLLKQMVRRSRPRYNKGMFLTFAVDHWSFPSGHSSRVFFISTFLYLVRGSLRELFAADPEDCSTVLDDRGLNKIAELYLPVVFLWSAATSASRVLLGRHFLCDVLAGGGLGVLEGLAVFLFFPSGSCDVIVTP